MNHCPDYCAAEIASTASITLISRFNDDVFEKLLDLGLFVIV